MASVFFFFLVQFSFCLPVLVDKFKKCRFRPGDPTYQTETKRCLAGKPDVISACVAGVIPGEN